MFRELYRLGFALTLIEVSSAFLPRFACNTNEAHFGHTRNTIPRSLHDDVLNLPHIDRVLCISDLHTDHADNMKWLANRTSAPDFLGENDLIVVAGDISHELSTLEESFSYLLQKGSSVVFVPGNHEAWLNSSELEAGRDSLQKLDQVYETCKKLGVIIGPVRVGNTKERPHGLWIVPLESWYDGTLSIQNLEDMCDDFGRWPWVDFIRCRWSDFPAMGGRNKKVPSGLVEFFLEKNIPILEKVQASITDSGCSAIPFGLMTVSHFLPNKQCLPDWKNVTSSTFLRDSWLDHGGGGMSAKFAKVAGTELLDDQIRTQKKANQSMRLIHLFGHSHRPKDFEMEGVRYIHNPLGKPREREIRMVSPEVDFQTVWDTGSGEVHGETVIRYWEEQGGGLEALRSRLQKSRKRSRYRSIQ